MKNFDYEKKYHYLVKYFVIAFPLVVVLFLTFLDTMTYPDYINFMDNTSSFLHVNINSWYFDLIDIIGLTEVYDNGGLLSYLVIYPLYVFWVYVLDLVLDIFAFVPKLAHKLMYKLGGN